MNGSIGRAVLTQAAIDGLIQTGAMCPDCKKATTPIPNTSTARCPQCGRLATIRPYTPPVEERVVQPDPKFKPLTEAERRLKGWGS